MSATVGRCLICYQGCGLLPKNEEEGFTSSSSLISKELHTMFILRNIFEVPPECIQQYLETGANPSEWITLCLKCKSVVEKAKRMYREILDASRRFRKVKGDIIQYLRRNKKGQGKITTKIKGNGMRMTDETRIFVSEHNYSDSLVDPFVGGDCQAAKLLFSSSSVVNDEFFVDNVKIEYICNDDDGSIGGSGADEEHEYYATESPQSNCSNYDESIEEASDTLTVTKGKVKSKKQVHTSTSQKSDPAIHKANGSSENSDGETMWFCSCGRSYTGSERLRRHLKEANMDPSEMHVCPLCDKQFKRRWDVKRHMKHHPGYEDKDVDDDIGFKVVNVKGNVEPSIHRNTTTMPKLQLVQNTGAVLHESKDVCKMADGTDYWNCTCGKIFLSQVTLQQHVGDANAESSAVEISCPICDKTFKRRFDRNRHMKKDHDMETSAVKQVKHCNNGNTEQEKEENTNDDEEQAGGSDPDDDNNDEDGQEGGTWGDEKHEELGLFEIADGSEQWKCSCGKSYSSQTALHRHAKEKNMDPSKWLPCPYTKCKKAFARRSQLKRHVDAVHEKKTYPCEKCGKVYTQITKLRVHQRIHCVSGGKEKTCST